MKILLILLMTVNLYAIDWNQWDDKDKPFFQQRDNQSHIVINGVLSAAITHYAREQGFNKYEAFLIGFASATALGYAKEKWYDLNYSDTDMQSWALGAGLGAAGMTLYEW